MAKKTKEKEAAAPVAAGSPRMLDHYVSVVRPQLAKALDRTNPHAIPKLEKIVVNMGVGVAVSEKKYLEEAIGAMTQVTGQKPIATISKAAVAGFKLRENLPIGCKVTLRGRRMYEFFDRLVSLALPRVRDFRGLSSTAFDGHGHIGRRQHRRIVDTIAHHQDAATLFPELANTLQFIRGALAGSPVPNTQRISYRLHRCGIVA